MFISVISDITNQVWTSVAGPPPQHLPLFILHNLLSNSRIALVYTSEQMSGNQVVINVSVLWDV